MCIFPHDTRIKVGDIENDPDQTFMLMKGFNREHLSLSQLFEKCPNVFLYVFYNFLMSVCMSTREWGVYVCMRVSMRVLVYLA